MLQYRQDELFLENINLQQVAKQVGTPCYIYSKKQIETNWKIFNDAFQSHPHLICYAVKANSNLSILNLFAKHNSGFDIVSLGELERVLAAGGAANQIVFSGVGKQENEIIRALNIGIKCFNVESIEELDKLHAIAKTYNKIAPISLRINPNVDAGTHPHIATGLSENKFGIPLEQIPPILDKLKFFTHLKLIGIGCHIGSQLLDLSPIEASVNCLLDVAKQCDKAGMPINHINVGGGLGIRYQDENPIAIDDYAHMLLKKLTSTPYELILEPGRILVADAGILLTEVKYLKHTPNKNFAIVDAAMNDLVRPALYDAWHNILPVNKKSKIEKVYDVVGPVCESADFLGKNRLLAIAENDLLAICTAGAYGFCMSSNYNSRPRAAEILIDNNKIHLIRKRETIEELYKHEIIL